MNILVSTVVIWAGCFVVVSIDSAYKKISPVFWRLASLFGGPFTLLAYGIIREKNKQKKGGNNRLFFSLLP